MDILTWAMFFLASGIVIAIFIISTLPLIRAPKNQPTIIRSIGLGLSFGVFLGSVLLLYDTQYSDLGMVTPAFRSFYKTIAVVVLTCFFLQVLFIRSIRKSVIDHKILLIFLVFISFIYLGFYSYNKDQISFDAPVLSYQGIFIFYRTLGFTLVMGWCFYELRKILKNQENFILKFMQILVSIAILHSLMWLIFISVDYNTNQSLSSRFVGVLDLNSNLRLVRLGFFCTFEILISIYWFQNYSVNAIKERQKKLQIQNLLLEKDILINKLANASTLIESGALSAGLAHELNQYLARIELNGDEVLQLISQGDTQSENIKLSVTNILGANHQAGKLIGSLKKLFRTNESEPVLNSVDDLVRDSVTLFADRAKKSNIKIKIDLQVQDQQLIWDSLFRQVVVNLLSNAIEALDTITSDNKIIQITSNIDSAGNYCLAIIDNGPGVHPTQEETIFNLFSTSKSSGTGVGLWLSRHIVERHRGSLVYQNLPNRSGVSFIVTLPMQSMSNIRGAGNSYSQSV